MTRTGDTSLPNERFAAAAHQAIDAAGTGPAMVAVWRMDGSELRASVLTRQFPFAEMLNADAILRDRIGVLKKDRDDQLRAEEMAKQAAKAPGPPAEAQPPVAADDPGEESSHAG